MWGWCGCFGQDPRPKIIFPKIIIWQNALAPLSYYTYYSLYFVVENLSNVTVESMDVTLLDTECKQLMNIAIDAYRVHCQNVLDGTVHVNLLTLIQAYKDSFLAIGTMLEEHHQLKIIKEEERPQNLTEAEVLTSVLQWRKCELDQFEHQKLIVNNFIGLVTQIRQGS